MLAGWWMIAPTEKESDEETKTVHQETAGIAAREATRTSGMELLSDGIKDSFNPTPIVRVLGPRVQMEISVLARTAIVEDPSRADQRGTSNSELAAVWTLGRMHVPASRQGSGDDGLLESQDGGVSRRVLPGELSRENAERGDRTRSTDWRTLVSQSFTDGFQAGGGPPEFLEHFLTVVIPKESGWNPQADNGVGHRGLTQFSKATWDAMMPEYPYFDNVFDPYLHGMAAARLVLYVLRTPGSTFQGQWSTW